MVTKKDHLKKVNCIIRGGKMKATIFVENNIFYLIQNFRAGSCPSGKNYKKYGKYGWSFRPDNLPYNGVEILNTETIYELW